MTKMTLKDDGKAREAIRERKGRCEKVTLTLSISYQDLKDRS
jgi:hypothetical protein